jgi:hypothetical protein
MKMDQFTRLDAMEQMEVFWNGVFVGELCEGEFKMICHQIDDFYVECKILGGHYLGMRVFKDPHFLEVYLNQVTIPDL